MTKRRHPVTEILKARSCSTLSPWINFFFPPRSLHIITTTVRKLQWNIPKWLVANCSSMLSWESRNGVAITPALLLPNKKRQCHSWIFKRKRSRSYVCASVREKACGREAEQFHKLVFLCTLKVLSINKTTNTHGEREGEMNIKNNSNLVFIHEKVQGKTQGLIFRCKFPHWCQWAEI